MAVTVVAGYRLAAGAGNAREADTMTMIDCEGCAEQVADGLVRGQCGLLDQRVREVARRVDDRLDLVAPSVRRERGAANDDRDDPVVP